MNQDDAIRELMAKLIRAVETSISASSAVREALAELVRSGYEARLFFVANAESAEAGEEDGDLDVAEVSVDPDDTQLGPEIGAVQDAGDLSCELTKLDRDFLKSLHIRPEGS